jgi:hypothetical protein
MNGATSQFAVLAKNATSAADLSHQQHTRLRNHLVASNLSGERDGIVPPVLAMLAFLAVIIGDGRYKLCTNDPAQCS